MLPYHGRPPFTIGEDSKNIVTSFSAIAAGFVCSLALAAAPLPQELVEQKLLNRIQAFDAQLDGSLGVFILDLTTGRTISYHGDTVFPTASSIKIPILIQMFKSAAAGEFKLTDPVTLQTGDAVGGSGHLRILLRNGPFTLSVRDLITAMIETSDNTATNKCIAMTKIDRINQTLRDLGFKQTRLQRKMLDTAASKQDLENISTPAEMARLVELIYRGKAVDTASSKQMLDILKLVDDEMRRAIPDSVEVASKPGELTGVRCETGVVLLPKRPFVLSVMSTFLSPGLNPVGPVTKMVFDEFEKLDKSNIYGNKLQ